MITTPIFYVNSVPHLGHLYTALLGDALSRWHQLRGRKTLLISGTDEHGSKVQTAADRRGMNCVSFCDEISNEFRHCFKEANICFDDFVRTTELRHKHAVCSLWQCLQERGFLYSGHYEGWYCIPDETFLGTDQVQEVKGPEGDLQRVSLESGHRVEWVREQNYMFRLSAFQRPLLRWLEENPEVITPKSRYLEVKSLVEKGLQDLSVSRPNRRVKWGIPVPNDHEHTIYVWIDALANYLTAIGYPQVSPCSSNLWPPDYQIMGKDITKFHAVYWPAILLAAGIPLPKRLITHAHWTLNKMKMSKSLGNVVFPGDLLAHYGVDPVRFFLLSEGGISEDGDFSHEKLFAKLKGELADNFGNLLGRCTSLHLNPDNCVPKLAGPISSSLEDHQFIETLSNLPERVDYYFQNVEFSKGIGLILEAIHQGNRYFQKNEPWKLKEVDEDAISKLPIVLYNTMESIRLCALLLQPIMPETMEKILDRLGVAKQERAWNSIVYGKGRQGSPLGNNVQFKPFQIRNIIEFKTPLSSSENLRPAQ